MTSSMLGCDMRMFLNKNRDPYWSYLIWDRRNQRSTAYFPSHAPASVDLSERQLVCWYSTCENVEEVTDVFIDVGL